MTHRTQNARDCRVEDTGHFGHSLADECWLMMLGLFTDSQVLPTTTRASCLCSDSLACRYIEAITVMLLRTYLLRDLESVLGVPTGDGLSTWDV